MNPSRPEPGQSQPTTTGWRSLLVLLVIGLAVYLPGLASIPPVDRDESRFAQASRQMLESVTLSEDQRDPELHAGGLVVPKVGGTDRLKKPPLIYWLQGASAWVFTAGDPSRDAIWMYRVPSVLGAMIAVLATWRIARTMMSERAALIAGAMLAVCPMVVWDAHQARADQVLLACTAVAMGALWHLWRTRDDARAGWVVPIVLWGAVGAGFMTKGLTPLIVGAAAVWVCIVTRQWRWLAHTKPVLGLVILTVLIAPWIIAVGSRVGWSEYFSIMFDETAGRSAGAKEGHWGPPGYHTVLSAVLFWPGSLLTLGAFALAWSRAGIFAKAEGMPWRARLASLPRRWRERIPADDAALFLVAWITPCWVFFELISTKLPHYTLPMYPALAIVTARALDGWISPRANAAPVRPPLVGVLIWSVIGIVWVATVPVAAAETLAGPIIPAIIGASLAGIALIIAVRFVVTGRLGRAHAWAIGSGVVFAITLLGVVAPRLGRIWVSPRITEHLPADGFPVGAVGYHEDSLVFFTRGRLERLPDDAGPAWLAANPAGTLIVPESVAESLPAAYEIVGEASGLNYSNGDAVDLRIVRSRDRPDAQPDAQD